MNNNNSFFLRFLMYFALFLFPSNTLSKVLFTRSLNPGSPISSTSSINDIRAIENRLRPSLEHKINRNSHTRGLPPDQNPSDADYLALPRIWNQLSTDFQQLYKSAATIPDSFTMYKSPSGHFEIYYSVSGIDKIDKTDNYKFSGTNWRIKVTQKNNVPDYIDEIGWALDSSWSQLVDNFGLIPPIPYKDAKHNSDIYKVIVEYQDPGYYGVTYPGIKSTNGKGYSSYMSIRNEWSDAEWAGTGYDVHPEDGIRVTCVHEFTHTIQYAMSWDVIGGVNLDDFTLPWLEGTATSMEEITFPYINDYLQYTKFFFMTPTLSFLEDDTFAYTNSLLFLYLHKFYGSKNGFMTQMQMSNYEKKQPFYYNLNNTSKKFGMQWVELLNQFHTASYFTNSRADSTRFLSDASDYMSWNYPAYNSTKSFYTKTINPFAMDRFFIANEDTDNDYLHIAMQGTVYSSQTEINDWAASVILDTDTGKSIKPVVFNSSGNGHFTTSNWRNCKDAIIVLTNGNPTQKRAFNVNYQFCPISYKPGDILDTIVTGSYQSRAHVRLESNADLYCNLVVDSTNDTNYLAQASIKSLRAISDLFIINYPLTWPKDSFSITFSVSPTLQYTSTKGSSMIYYYDSLNNFWTIVPTSKDSTETNLYSCTITNPGTYGLFQNAPENKIDIFPNVTKNSNGYIYFRGTGTVIEEVRLYSADGVIVEKMNVKTIHQPFTPTGNQTYKLNLSKCGLIPGIYFAVVRYHSDSEDESHPFRTKVMIVP